MNSTTAKTFKKLYFFTSLLIIVFSAWTKQSVAQKYTASFASAPAFTQYPGVPSWIQIAEVTLGGVVYQVVNGGNGGWAQTSTGGNGNSSNIAYSPASTMTITIQRKDGKMFNFYGAWLKYTNYVSYYLPPYLRVSYNGSSLPAEEFAANSQVTLSKEISVSSVSLNFSGLNTLNFDDLIVGPTIVTTNVINLFSGNTATPGGTVLDDAAGVSERGVVYNTAGSPTTADFKVELGSGTGAFSQTVTGLNNSTSYYVRAYAINSNGTTYGNQETFTTAAPFTVPNTYYFNSSWVSTVNQPSPFTKHVEGWDITGESTTTAGLISISRITSSSSIAEGTASLKVASTTSTENLVFAKFKASNGAAFDLQSFKFRYGTKSSGTSFGKIIVTGYKNGVPVTGAVSTLEGIANVSSSTPGYTTFDVSGNASFRSIDEFILHATEPVNAARLSYFDLDLLVVKAPQALSTNANLSSLSVGSTTLSATSNNYTASVANNITSVNVTPAAEEAHASIKVNGIVVASGHSLSVDGLSVGANTITIEVTAQDGTNNKTYSLVVTRAASSNAVLSNLEISEGTLATAFQSTTTTYSTVVANSTSSLMLTPTVQDASASVTVNGKTTASGTASESITLNEGLNNIVVEVTAQDGTTKNSYVVNVTRARSIIITAMWGSANCAGDALEISFTSTEQFNDGNIFTAELSDASGSFASPTVIGSYAGTVASYIETMLPAHLQDGSNYRIRVSSSNPAITGAGLDGPLTIHDRPMANVISGFGNVNVNVASPYALDADSASTLLWSGAVTNSQNGDTAYITFPSMGLKQQLQVVEISQYGCIGDTSSKMVNVREARIDHVTVSSLTPCPSETLTVTAKVAGMHISHTFFAELSDANGSFAKPRKIGSTMIVADSYNKEYYNNQLVTISATLPYTLANGNGYRIRVVASWYRFEGSDNGQDIQVSKPVLGPDKTVYKCAGSTVDIRNRYVTTGLITDWSTLTPASITQPGTYTLIVTNANGCKDTANIIVAEYPQPYVGPDKTVNIVTGNSVNLTTLYDTTGYSLVKWSTKNPQFAGPGNYRLIVNSNGCKDTAYVTVTKIVAPAASTGSYSKAASKPTLAGIESRLSLALFPNPASDASTLRVSGMYGEFTVSITDNVGRELWKSTKLSSSIISLPVEKLAAGIYFVAVNDGKEIKTVQLLKR